MSTKGGEHEGADDGQGFGPEGTIPVSDDGVAAGAMDEASNFEPEEDSDDDGGS